MANKSVFQELRRTDRRNTGRAETHFLVTLHLNPTDVVVSPGWTFSSVIEQQKLRETKFSAFPPVILASH